MNLVANVWQMIASAVNSSTHPRDRGGRKCAHGTPTCPQSSASGTDAASIATTDLSADEFAQCFLAIFATLPPIGAACRTRRRVGF